MLTVLSLWLRQQLLPRCCGEEGQEEGGALLWIILLIVVFSVVIFAARGVRKQLAYVVAEKEGEEIELNKSVKEKLR